MKRQIYILTSILLLLGVSSCKTEQPDFYDSSANGVYFLHRGSEMVEEYNFADYILQGTDSMTVTVNIRRMGYLLDQPLKVNMKVKDIEDMPHIDVTIPDIEFKPKEYIKKVKVRIKRPETRDQTYGACLYFDPQEGDELSSTIKEFSELNLHISESYEKPNSWDWSLGIYLGQWTPEKHIFMVQTLKDSVFAQSQDWSQYPKYNEKAVNALRKRQQDDPKYVVDINIPFSQEATYDKPFYWADFYSKYLGEYSSNTFFMLTQKLSANTTNEVKLLGGDEAHAKELNKVAVLGMMDSYNTFFSYQYRADQYKSKLWIPMLKGVDYQVAPPMCWTEHDGTKALIEKYYGAYSESKYKFMLSTWLEAKGESDFCIVQLFPVQQSYDKSGKPVAQWDESIGGEGQIRKCYEVLKAKYDASPGSYDFTFPEVI